MAIMKKKELLKRVARAELRVDIHYQMLKETNLEVDKLKECIENLSKNKTKCQRLIP